MVKIKEAVSLLCISLRADEDMVKFCDTPVEKKFRRKMIRAKKMAISALQAWKKSPESESRK
jgi:hypothetical protein